MSNNSIPQVPRPSEEEIALARESSQKLSQLVSGHPSQHLQVHIGGHLSDAVEIPASAVKILLQGLSEIGKGNEVRLVATNAELTTQEAAEILNFSRQYVVRLIDDGKIPSHKVGTHRRVRLDDVLAFKQKSDKERLEALKALVADGQELDMGY